MIKNENVLTIAIKHTFKINCPSKPYKLRKHCLFEHGLQRLFIQTTIISSMSRSTYIFPVISLCLILLQYAVNRCTRMILLSETEWCSHVYNLNRFQFFIVSNQSCTFLLRFQNLLLQFNKVSRRYVKSNCVNLQESKIWCFSALKFDINCDEKFFG